MEYPTLVVEGDEDVGDVKCTPFGQSLTPCSLQHSQDITSIRLLSY